jgi:hypothetical protein
MKAETKGDGERNRKEMMVPFFYYCYDRVRLCPVELQPLTGPLSILQMIYIGECGAVVE